MTTLCLCDWVESDEHRTWRATTNVLATGQTNRNAALVRDRFTDNIGKSGSARYVVPSNAIIQEYVS